MDSPYDFSDDKNRQPGSRGKWPRRPCIASLWRPACLLCLSNPGPTKIRHACGIWNKVGTTHHYAHEEVRDLRDVVASSWSSRGLLYCNLTRIASCAYLAVSCGDRRSVCSEQSSASELWSLDRPGSGLARLEPLGRSERRRVRVAADRPSGMTCRPLLTPLRRAQPSGLRHMKRRDDRVPAVLMLWLSRDSWPRLGFPWPNAANGSAALVLPVPAKPATTLEQGCKGKPSWPSCRGPSWGTLCLFPSPSLTSDSGGDTKSKTSKRVSVCR
ncbi:hypothetical protein GGR56DRAFT_605169 [Xylariaceae sp. FL0804]|nr:hypothetical protein GGR56DRAFT_605169 [Xylariaceae sp. FL0804]